MRLFVALEPPAEVLADLATVAAELRERPDATGNVRWSSDTQWHLTLAFLGAVGEDRLPELSRRLTRAASRHGPVRLWLSGGGGFGSAKSARVLWVGVDGDRKPLRVLAGSVAAGARKAGIDVREGRFRAHVTLARLREPADVRPFVERLASYTGPAWTVDRIHLIRSHLGQGEAGRARYETVETFPLA